MFELPQCHIVKGGTMPENPETEGNYAEMQLPGQRMIAGVQKTH